MLTHVFKRLLSNSAPHSKTLKLVLLAIFLGLASAPFITSGARPLNTAATICVYIILVGSYDLLLGYTGIVSFAHTMFFGIGAYGVAFGLQGEQATWSGLLVGLFLAILLAFALAFIIGLFALRVRAIFYSMITLAVASSFSVLASQLSDWTGGEDGKTFSVPELLSSSFELFAEPILGRHVDGKVICYYLVFICALLLFLLMLRIVHSPFGRTLQALRENDFRAEAIGYKTVYYRIAANCIAAVIACLAGALMALWLKYVGPKTMLSFEVMTDILLIVVIGGMGSLYGSVIGATLFLILQNYLKNLMAQANESLVDLPLLAQIFHPDRWLFWLGILFVLSVYFFPSGIVGKLNRARPRKEA
ncbi:branched-chain amino acid ABC transporter permease [Undibacterium cyanobacteriorum]|uniref:Branched-chain amino acid ABC transporter permease n=1 Tax=Undibacterium cyanobacteriorum TaxID=3073561 RepID=A0ABY9RG51_9BURK|nr:branched-chain amino acid ABC transporter permease [Undibacterium sp. 20NA77.5]WMW79828.1 branched-chain amino acid ABC transporter permease [Undibacterium sp. 20NA77.5]